MRAILLFVTISTLLFLGCNLQKYNAETYKGKQVMFGSGGGVTGDWQQYALLQNGRLLYRSSSDTNYVQIKKIKQAEAQTFILRTEKLKDEEKNVNKPGNMTNFLAFKHGKELHGFRWATNAKIPTELKKLFEELMAVAEKDK